MGYPGPGEPAVCQPVHQSPCCAVSLATPAQGATPKIDEMMTERRKSARVCWHGVIGKEASNHRPQPRALFSHALVPTPSEVRPDLQQLRLLPIAPRMPGEQEAALPCARADMGKAQEVERLRLAVPPRRPVAPGPRPNSIRRVFSGCNSKANSATRMRSWARNASASDRCSKPTTVSSAYRTTTMAPVAWRLRHCSVHRS